MLVFGLRPFWTIFQLETSLRCWRMALLGNANMFWTLAAHSNTCAEFTGSPLHCGTIEAVLVSVNPNYSIMGLADGHRGLQDKELSMCVTWRVLLVQIFRNCPRMFPRTGAWRNWLILEKAERRDGDLSTAARAER